MAVDGISNYSNYSSSGRKKEPVAKPGPDGQMDYSEFFAKEQSGKVSSQDFFNLMAAQLKNQDFNNPMDNSQMLAQMAQFQTMEVMQTLSYNMNQNLAVSMLGKNVVIGELGADGQLKTTEGTIEKVGLAGGGFQYFVNGKAYGAENIMEVKSKLDKDNPKPVLKDGEAGRTSHLNAEITFQSSKAGKVYYEIVEPYSNVPEIDVTGEGLSVKEGKVEFPILLTKGAKDVYIVVKSAEGIVSDPMKITIDEYKPEEV